MSTWLVLDAVAREWLDKGTQAARELAFAMVHREMGE
ncbi:hypothetical protein BCF44_107290 [Kutzneria buriramensis]|uniref:Uncharacterized protein n=1 Tax=Kutzneria buriramensis TaxID=1045776 RepID=A0A3E0HI90_9PSEU|nr:hypothetical protein BCF44_107290 [Kutzneria buriramensis]